MRNPKDQAFVRSNVLIKKFMFPFLAKLKTSHRNDMRNWVQNLMTKLD